MVTRADVVREARSWKDTPFHHQGRLKGVGADCAGLILGVAHALGLPSVDLAAYGRIPNGRHLRLHCNSAMDPISIEKMRPGDVLLLRLERFPQHLAFVVDGAGLNGLGLVHSYEQPGKCVEHGLTQEWHDRTVQAYRLHGLED